MKRWLIHLLCCGLLAGCSQPERLPYYHAADGTPLWEGENAFLKDTLHTIAPFAFTNQDGQRVTNATFRNKIYVAAFFFTRCRGICPKLTTHLSKVAAAFQDQPDVQFIFHTVTPESDSVPQLQAYSRAHDINSDKWHLVTGEKEKIYTLARQSYFAEREIGFQSGFQQFLHTEQLVLIDREGHIRGIYNGTLELEAERLMEDIQLLLSIPEAKHSQESQSSLIKPQSKRHQRDTKMRTVVSG